MSTKAGTMGFSGRPALFTFWTVTVSVLAAAALTLTPTEARVAELVAAGGTNREVADALFVSVHTVEANLKRIYRKLGIRSRTELASTFPSRPSGS